MTEHQRAKAWRENHGLTMEQLSALTGYSLSAIWWFEKGIVPPSRNRTGKKRAHDEFVWQRYKMCCAGVQHTRLNGAREFKW